MGELGLIGGCDPNVLHEPRGFDLTQSVELERKRFRNRKRTVRRSTVAEFMAVLVIFLDCLVKGGRSLGD